MSKEITKEDVIMNKKQAIKSLNQLLEGFIDEPEHIKKANLISYWLKSYVKYLSFEERFESAKLIRYPRGSVIRLDFGFNIGKEFGGLHYAVVIDNDNKRNADVLTVIPLSSSDGRSVHPRSVDLGTELFEKVKAVQNTLLSNAQEELTELEKMKSIFDNTLDLLRALYGSGNNLMTPEFMEKLSEAAKHKTEMEEKEASVQKTIATITRNNQEIAKLKSGSMAVINQITTVSKQRIYTPKRAEDFLYGIRLSTTAMEKINSKIKELYIH